FDPVPFVCRKARKSERDTVGARPQVGNIETALRVRHGAPHFFDKSGTRSFNSDAGKNGASRIPLDTANACRGLRVENSRAQYHGNQKCYCPESLRSHALLPSTRRSARLMSQPRAFANLLKANF